MSVYIDFEFNLLTLFDVGSRSPKRAATPPRGMMGGPGMMPGGLMGDLGAALAKRKAK